MEGNKAFLGVKRKRLWLCLAVVLSLALVPAADSCVESPVLRGESSCSTSNSNLLFWSSYDFSEDAAAQFLGPLDIVLRGGATDDTMEVAYTIDAPEDAAAEESNRTTNLRNQAVVSDKNKMIFSLFQKGDGSDTDPNGIPTRYLLMQNYHRGRALHATEATLKWRADHDVDRILTKPQTKFDICKKVFPHYFLGRDKDNHVIFLQRPALIDLQLGRKYKLTNEDLLMHYVYVNEYLWQILEAANPLGTMISLLDLTGLDLSVLKKRDLIGFCKKFVSTMDAHFPQRAHKTLILNAPKWFNALYKIFSPLLRESTKAKIEIYSRGKKQDEALRRVLGDKVAQLVPPSIWSHKKRVKGVQVDVEPDHPHHREDPRNEVIPETDLEHGLRAFTLARIKASGARMQVLA